MHSHVRPTTRRKESPPPGSCGRCPITRAVLDDLLAEEAVQLATQCRLRGADAVYGAVAKRHGCKLVTRDQQQLDRLKGAVTCLTPEEALAQLDAATAAS